MERRKNGLCKFLRISKWILTVAWFGFGIFSWFWGGQLTAEELRWMFCVACFLLALYNLEGAVNEC